MATATTSTNSTNQALVPQQTQLPLLFSPIDVPFEVVIEKILPFLNAISVGTCTGLSKTWKVITTEKDDLWRILFDRDYQSIKLNPIENYQQTYKCLHFNFTKGVSLPQTLQEKGSLHEVPESFAVADGQLFSCFGNDIKIWDIETGVYIDSLKGHQGKVNSLAIDNGKLFSISADKTIKKWDLETRVCISTIPGGDGFSFAIGNGKLFFRNDDIIKMLDLETEICLAELPASKHGMNSLVAADEKLFSCHNYSNIRIYGDSDKNYCKGDTLLGHQKIICILMYVNGKLYSGSNDNTIKIWDVEKKVCIDTLKKSSGVRALATAFGKVFSGFADNNIEILDLETGVSTATLLHKNSLSRMPGVTSFAIANGRLITGYQDGSIIVRDFTADHDIIFEYIAELFVTDPYLAHDLFVKMLSSEKNETYAKLHDILNPPLEDDYPEYGEHAFHGVEGLRSTPAQKAQAIRARLGELPAKQSPSLAHLGFHTRKDFYDKLNCKPEDLQKVGISSLEDLKCICSLSSLKKLSPIEVKETKGDRGSKINAKNRMCELANGTQELLEIVDKIKEKTAVGTWTTFQQKLNAFQAKLHEIGQQCDGDPTKILHLFSGENYNVLAREFNAFIEVFETDIDLQVAKLHAYVNQKGLLNVWRNQMNAGVRSIEKLPPSEQTWEKLLRIGE